MIISELKSLTMLIIIMKMVMTKMAMVKMRMMLNMIVMMFTLVKKMMNMNMMMMMMWMMVNMSMLTSGFGGSVAANWRSVLSGGQMLATDSLPHDDDGDDGGDGDDDDGDDGEHDGGDVNLGKVASWRVLKANLSTSMFLTQLNLRVPSLWISI